MYAQLIQGGTTPELRMAMDRIVTDKLIPALREEPGYTGALNLVEGVDAGCARVYALLPARTLLIARRRGVTRY